VSRRYGEGQPQFVLPRPGKGLRAVLLGVFAIWLMFAVAINWAGASDEVFYLLCGNTERILAGEVWRLFTAPLLHIPSGGVGHILTAVIGLYFLAPSLEESWGTGRFLRFLYGSAVLAYAIQVLVELALPASVASKLVPPYWFGSIPAIEAVAIAFALSIRQEVRLFFVLPVSPRGLIIFVVGMSLLFLIAGVLGPSGHIAPFGGMLCGWLLGGGNPSPLRRFYLRWRLAQLDEEAKRVNRQRKQRAAQSGLRVIEGGRKEPGDGPTTNGKSGERRGPDGQLLN
jgi:membrane associated rhomboid family serine protease